MAQAPSNLIPTRITQLQEDPAPSNQGYLVYVRDGVTYKVKAFDILNITGVPPSRNVLAGTGMTGGGPLSTDVTLGIAPGGVDGTQLASTGVTPGVYGNSSNVPQLTVDAKGRVTAATTLPLSGPGLGSVTSVDVSGGSTGLNFSGGPITTYGSITMSGTLGLANGGTGATSAATALTSLGAVGTIASADGSVTLSRVGSDVDLSATSTTRLIAQVRNQTGSTLTKGTVVYISGASGNKALVSKALATGDSTSAQTYGMVNADITNNQNGYVTVVGAVAGLDTSAYAEGAQLYLSTTVAGTFTATKVYAPGHLVYVGVVTRQHVSQGEIEVKIQNGYEMDELHDVSAQTPSNGQTLVYNTATSLWESNTVPLGLGVSGTLPILNGGTGATTAGAALTALGAYPVTNPAGYTTNVGTVTDVTGTAPIVSSGGAAPAISISAATTGAAGSMSAADKTKLDGIATGATANTGTVTSVAASVPAFLSIAGSPVTTAGTLAITYSGTALPVANGGTGATTLTANNVLLGNGASALQVVAPGTSGNVLTSNGTTWQSTAPVSGPASNLLGGAASQLAYQSAPNTTAFLANGTAGQVLVSAGASAPTWGSISGGTF